MSERVSRLERFFERAAGLGATAELHPSQLLHAVQEAARASERDGAMANAYRAVLSPADLAFFERHAQALTREVVGLAEGVSRERRLRPPGPWTFELAVDEREPGGSIRVEAMFRNAPSSLAATAPVTGATQAIVRQRGKFLVVQGHGRARLTHTPFTIGRSAECDLSIPDMAISRKHARIDTDGAGRLVMRDLGSRNQLKVGRQTLAEVVLEPGLVVELGGSAIHLEDEA